MKKHYFSKFLTILVFTFLFQTKMIAQYCTSTYTYACSSGDYVDNFSTTGGVTNITNNGTGCNGNTNNYIYYSSLSASQIQGQTISFSMQCGQSWSQGFIVGIDLDNNNSFLDPGEVIFSSAASTAVQTFTYTVPIGATPGIKRMRVVCRWATTPTSADFCSTSLSFGETEDYNFNVISATPCSGTPVAGAAVANISNPCPGVPVTFTLSGSSNSGNLGYQWQRSVNNGTSWTTLNGQTNFSYTVTPPASLTYCYRCIVTCLINGLKDTSTMACITVQPYSPTSPCYCTPTNTGGSCLTNVSIGSLSNTTAGCTGINNYNIYTTPVPNLIQNLGYSFSATLDATGITSVWIDYNHDCIFDATEWTPVFTSAMTGAATITIPTTSLTGQTRMRVRGSATFTTNGAVNACTAMNSGETEDYIINIIPASTYDPGISTLTAPTGTCLSHNETVTAQICNYGTSSINLVTNPITVNLRVNGPNGIVLYPAVLNTGTMNAGGTSCYTATFNNVDLYAGGAYSLNLAAPITISGLINGFIPDDSLQTPIYITNYRPTPGPIYNLCKGSTIGFGQGLLVSGCAAPISDSVELTFITTPCIDNVGATTTGTTQGPGNANCANVYAGDFAHATKPVLPVGAYFTGSPNAVLKINNLSSGYITEDRFILYGGASAFVGNIYAPCPQGYNASAGNIILAGQSVGNNSNFTNTRQITPAQLSAMFNDVSNTDVHVGYFETYNDLPFASDIGTNAGATTEVKLKIYYKYIPTSINWYETNTSTSILDTVTPFNPFLHPNSVVNNSNVAGDYVFYAACNASPTCRVADTLRINPTPLTYQDTLTLCESTTGSNIAIFNLPSMNSAVSGNVLGTSVDYFFDQNLFGQIPTPATDTSSTIFVYAKVFNTLTGCYSSDSLLLEVNPIPEFTSTNYAGFACSPSTLDVASLLSGNSLAGLDTLYYSDPACTIIFPNPHSISIADTVYIVAKTQGLTVCSDTAVAYIDITPASGMVVNQSSFNTSISGSVGCNNLVLTDGGATDTLHNSADCRRIAAIRDEPDGVSLGITSVCEEIDATVQYHNGQPYVFRHYQITPTNNDSAMVCLYFLDDDFDQYNATVGSSWPNLPSYYGNGNMALASNFCIAKIDNGDLTTAGHTVTSIPNTSITSSYDPTSTVWTLCFPVSNFSYFYLHSQNPSNIPLPVTATFTGKKVDQTSELTWITSMEYNNSHFVIERSKDGRTFTALSNEIASKAVNGNSSEKLTYTFTDKAPMSGHNYYRLQQNDIDKHQSYHPTIVDIYYGSEEMVSVYPNPMSSTLTVEINVPKATNAIAKIIDATGRVVRTTEMQLQTGFNKNVIDVQDLADGVYMIQISNNKGLNFSQTIRKK